MSAVASGGAARASLVVPVYRNEGSLPALLEAIGALHRELDGGLEAVFVVDGSPDNSYLRLAEALPRAPFPSQLVGLSRNFGSFAAIRAGLEVATGEAVAAMAADLQEPPEWAREALGLLLRDEADVVVGHRIARDDPWSVRLLSGLFWRAYRAFVQREVPPGGVDIFACGRKVRDALLRLDERNTSLVGQIFWVGYRRRLLPYERRARQGGGGSGWTFARRFRYMLDSVFSFTDLPISLITATGTVGTVASGVVALAVGVAWLAGRIHVSGYTPIMLMLALSTSLNLLALGLVGGYVWRTFENSKQRPRHLVAEHRVFPGGAAGE